MVSRKSRTAFTTASITGFEPGPLLAVYHASNAFVLSFSEALATEPEDTEITVRRFAPDRPIRIFSKCWDDGHESVSGLM